jgi:mRNA interferase MazF
MFKFGTIVLVPFPFTDLTSTKVRPALILSKTDAEAKDLVLAFITSRTDEQNKRGRFLLKVMDRHAKKTGLKVDSLIRFDKLATLNKKIILGELGTLDKEVLAKAKTRFQEVFGF